MTDKVQKIREEVQRLQSELIQEKEKGFGSDIDDACILELQNVLTFIDSMGENRPEPISPADVGFEALGRFWDEEVKKDSGELGHSVTKKSDQEEPVSEELENIAENYAYNKAPSVGATNTEIVEAFISGANWQKQQMMKDAVDAFVYRGGIRLKEWPLSGARIEKTCPIKLIIIKQEEE